MTFFNKRIFAVALLAMGALAWAAPAPQNDPLFGEIDEIVAELSRITGLKPLRQVQCERIPKDQVKPFLEQRVKESVKPEEIRAEEIALKKLGFVPEKFNLQASTVDLMSEQAAAFYDFRKKKLFIIDTGTDELQHSALVHELAHALADQHFHLERFIGRANKDDESSLARMAVMEGQASWLMSEYLTQRTGQSLKDSPVLVRMMSRVGESSTGQFPVFDEAPLYLRETLLFPYSQGMLFQHAVFEKLDKAAFREVFEKPPVSTQQILHPEKYLQGVRPVHPALPELSTHRRYRNYTGGELGELDHSVLLRQYTTEEAAAAIAPQLRGSGFRLLEKKKGKRIVLLYASEWESAHDAILFSEAYEKVLKGKWKAFAVEAREAGRVAGRGDDGYFLLRTEGARVTSIEGLESLSEVTP